jgi:hypothetical protein
MGQVPDSGSARRYFAPRDRSNPRFRDHLDELERLLNRGSHIAAPPIAELAYVPGPTKTRSSIEAVKSPPAPGPE